MTVYDAEFASLYDLFYGDKPYEAEAAFVDQLIREHAWEPPRRLLDVACGTGQHSVRFADAGWTVVGIDRSPAMLAIAEVRRATRPVAFEQQDMTALDLDEPPFDAAVCLFDSIGYAITNERVLSTLAGIRRQLRTGGLAVIEFWHAAAMLTSYEPRREREWTLDGGVIRRLSSTTLDVSRQVARVEYMIEWRNAADDLIREAREVHENRYFLVQEIGFFLSSAGFEMIDSLPGYMRRGVVDESTWHVLALARATGSESP